MHMYSSTCVTMVLNMYNGSMHMYSSVTMVLNINSTTLQFILTSSETSGRPLPSTEILLFFNEDSVFSLKLKQNRERS